MSDATTTTGTRTTARIALSLRPELGTGRWGWSLAGEGFSRTGSVSARDREDAAVCSIAAAYVDLRSLGPVEVVVSLPVRARLWALSHELSGVFVGVTVVPYDDADVALRLRAMQALEPESAVDARTRKLPPLTVATDGSAAHRRIGWGWLAGDGRHGYGAAAPSRRSCTARTLPVLAELRGISAAVQGLPGLELTIHTDSRAAMHLIRSWIAGEDRLPPGYTAGPHAASVNGGLIHIRDQMRREAHRIDIRWIRGHDGDPLNEGADSLAKLARRHAEGRWGLTDDEIPTRAASIATAFTTAQRQYATAA